MLKPYLLYHPEVAQTSVLIVEDLEDLGQVLAELLVGYGYHAKCVSSFNLASQTLLNARFDVAIIDANLGARSGLDLAKHVAVVAPLTKVIVMSGYPIEKTLRNDPVLSEIVFLGKPFTPAELYASVRKALNISAA